MNVITVSGRRRVAAAKSRCSQRHIGVSERLVRGLEAAKVAQRVGRKDEQVFIAIQLLQQCTKFAHGQNLKIERQSTTELATQVALKLAYCPGRKE